MISAFIILLFLGIFLMFFTIAAHKKMAPWLIIFLILTSLTIIFISAIMILTIGFFLT